MGGARHIVRTGEPRRRKGLANIVKYLRANVFRYELDAYIAFRRRPPAAEAQAMQPHGLRFGPVQLGNAEALDALVRAWPAEWRGRQSDEAIRRTIQSELGAGDQCYAYWDNESIVAASWIGFQNSPYLKKFARAFGLEANEALRRTTFVDARYRGKKLQVLLARDAERYVAEQHGIQRFIVYVGIRNTASLRNLMKVYEECRPVYHVRLTILGREFDWFPKKDDLEWTRLQETDSNVVGS